LPTYTTIYNLRVLIASAFVYSYSADNGTASFIKCKQLFEYQHLLLLRDIWQSFF
jgi:hypothetical protein